MRMHNHFRSKWNLNQIQKSQLSALPAVKSMLAIYDNLDQLIDQISFNRGTLEVRFKDKVKFNDAYSKIQKYMNQSTIGIEPSKYNFNGTEIRTVANLVSNIHGKQAAAGMGKVANELKLKPETFAAVGAKQPVVAPAAAKPLPAAKPVIPVTPAKSAVAPSWQHGSATHTGASATTSTQAPTSTKTVKPGRLHSSKFMGQNPFDEQPVLGPSVRDPTVRDPSKPGGMKR